MGRSSRQGEHRNATGSLRGRQGGAPSRKHRDHRSDPGCDGSRGRDGGGPARRRRAGLPRRLGARGARVQRRAPQAVLRSLREPRGLLRPGLRGLDRPARRQPAGSGGRGAGLAGERPGRADAGSSSSSASGRRSPARSSSRCRSPAARRWPSTTRRSIGSPSLLDSVRTEIEPDQEPPEATGIFVVGGHRGLRLRRARRRASQTASGTRCPS